MKVYRGYNKEIGPISYPDWIYVTQDLEQAKYYATRNGAVEDGAIIEYNMADDLKFISIDYVNKIMDNGDPYNQEYYTEEDLLWYQDGLADYLYRYGAGIKFEDPEYEGHIIYILFNEKYLTNGRILSKEEFDRIQIKESVYENELNDVLKRAGIQLDEKVVPVNKDLADTKLVTSAYELNEIIKRNTEERVVYDKEKNWFLIGNGENSIHIELINDALKDGIYPPFEWNGHIIDGNGGDGSDDDGGIFYQINPKRFVLFRTSSDSLNGEDYYYDRYQYCYIYKDYCVFTRDTDFEETPLYKLLGEPLDIENNGNVLEDEGLKESILDAKSVGDELMNIILKNPTRKELSDNNMNTCRGAMGKSGNFYFISLSELAHCDLFDTLEQMGIYDAPYNTFKYSNKTNTFYYYDPDNDLDFNLIKKELEASPYFKNFAGCHFDTFTDPDYDPDLYEGCNPLNESVNKGIDFVAYHGGVEPDMIPATDRALYLTDSFELAHKFAKREIWNDGLYVGEIPTVFTFKGHFNNPYYMTLDEYNDEGQDSNIDIQKWIEKGVDGIVLLPNEEGSTTYYIVIDTSTIKLIDKKVFEDEAILDESVVDAMDVNGYTTYMYKNPTMKELRDDKEANGEFRVVRVNDDFFFGDAGYWIHDYMDESDDAVRLFYNLNTNTFYQDFETISDEEYNEFYQNFVESMQEPYILNTFPNCKFKLFSKTKADNDTPFGLSESVFWRGERINNYEQHHYPWPEENKGYDPEDEMIVWKNPSAEWMKYQIDSGKYFRFTYITTEDTLFVWYGDDAFHTDTMDIAGVDGDVVGTMGKGFIDYWPDDDDSPALGDRLFREKRAKFLDVIYPNGYDTGVQY